MSQNYDRAHRVSELDAARIVFTRQRALAEHCLAQLDDATFFRRPAPHLNSAAILVQHLAGNLHSRWSDFDAMLAGTADGEKDSRNRDAEFAAPDPTAEGRATLMRAWSDGWAALHTALDHLTTPGAFDQTITIRGAAHSIHLAVMRQLDHYGYHVGQIATTARLLHDPDTWSWFTIAPGESNTFTTHVRAKNAPPTDAPPTDIEP